ncbi:hypothetical protein BZA77DRAFT_304031 [Pyronema omphalodes]|nr:hypothetical protein BZA77DRAFT_304031 [Pyronema omphalodes]
MLLLLLFVVIITVFIITLFLIFCLPFIGVIILVVLFLPALLVLGLFIIVYLLKIIITPPVYLLYKLCCLVFNFQRLYLYYGSMLPVFFLLACLYAWAINKGYEHRKALKDQRDQRDRKSGFSELADYGKSTGFDR